MLTKESLLADFTRNWKQHYELAMFREKGFVRNQCAGCAKHFWTLDNGRTRCGDSGCEPYSFIGKPITTKKLDYIEMWKAFASFFKKNGHTEVARYPVIDRWRPDLYFTIASIQDFQRIDAGNLVMEYPADPLIVPQVCLRFNDIPNVGVTGRHHTSFIMAGQHSFGTYWKDRCIALNFEFLSKVLGVPETELTYVEDMWTMPDFSQFGPCIETFSRGLELVNSVFSQFTAAGSGYKELPQKVIDVGWGHERLVWFSQGTPTSYDAVFGPVLEKMKKAAGVKTTDLFLRYAALAGTLDFETKNAEHIRQEIAHTLGLSVRQLEEEIVPLQALYAIADHTKTLLFAVADGGIPSNVGGGYNLRVLLRRSLGFLKEFGFPFELPEIAEWHAQFLKPLFPELKNGLPLMDNIVAVEKERYDKMLEKAEGLITKHAKTLTAGKLVELYVSNGITPEIVQAVSRKEKLDITIPADFYAELTKTHLAGAKAPEAGAKQLEVTGYKPTRALYYEDPFTSTFTAQAIGQLQEWLILDQTAFYPEGGGQPADTGTIEAGGRVYEVTDVQKISGVVAHRLRTKEVIRGAIKGKIDWVRRKQLMQMHDATHLVAGACRAVVGSHIWQAGAQKGTESSRLDVTHFQKFSSGELETIEKKANDMVTKNLVIHSDFLPRAEAEKRYGFTIYQGGASPGKTVRIVREGDFDIEACGGTHLTRTGDIGLIKIIRAERIQDGVNRIEFAAGPAAEAYVMQGKTIAAEILHLFPAATAKIPADPTAELRAISALYAVEPAQLPKTAGKFLSELTATQYELERMGSRAGVKTRPLSAKLSGTHVSLFHFAEALFAAWKAQHKEKEAMVAAGAQVIARELLINPSPTVRVFMDLMKEEMIAAATEALRLRPHGSFILANHAGEVVGMSKTQDMAAAVRELCRQAGGSGGGRTDFAQGKADVGKLKALLEK